MNGRHLRRLLFLILATITVIPAGIRPLQAADGCALRTVILVRHAEKVSTAADSVLTPAGVERANELARVLTPADIRHIIVTQFPRVKLTAGPLSAKLGITPIVVDAGESHAAAVVARIKSFPAGETVLVIGHSNTLPQIIAALGIVKPVSIADSAFDDLFVCTIPASGTPTVVRLAYGK